MSARDDVAAFSRGAMDRIRDYCGIGRDLPCGLIEVPGGWEVVVPGRQRDGGDTLYEFRMVPHGKLAVRVSPSKTFQPIAWVRSRDEALGAIDDFLRGL